MRCGTKWRYVDEIAAKLALAKIQSRDSSRRPKSERRAYRCGNHWHLTSQGRGK